MPRTFRSIAAQAKALIFALSLAGCAICPRNSELAFDPELAKTPPLPRIAGVELLPQATAAGNAVLRVRFEGDTREKRRLVVQGADGSTLLHDDGIAPDNKAADGLFAATVQVNLDAFAQEQRRRIGLADGLKSVPVFGFRELLGFEPFTPSPVAVLERGVFNPLDHFHGVPITVDPERELLIRDTSVVEDAARTYDACSGTGTPLGAWTFGRLMTEIANEPVTGIDPSDFVEHWLSQWKSDLTINGFTVPNRAAGAQAVMDAWPKLPSGKLDLAQAPFRLLAIVNRQDLRGNLVYGGSGDAGEARLVFGLLHCIDVPGDHFHSTHPEQVQQMTVIFEYGIARSGCVAVRNWAAQWAALGSLVLGSAPYNAALQALTDQFTLRDANPSRPPNRSAINQVRTNEFALASPPVDALWAMRESKLVVKGANSGLLQHGTTAQTPDLSFKIINTARTRDYINDNTVDILAGTHAVPLTYPLVGGMHFRGANAEPGAGSPWSPAGTVDLEARHRFSLATCDGCHIGERTAVFLHIAPRPAGVASALSNFLTGAHMPIDDPVSHVSRTFHELLDRQMKLDATAHLTCFKLNDFPLEELAFRPLPRSFPH